MNAPKDTSEYEREMEAHATAVADLVVGKLDAHIERMMMQLSELHRAVHNVEIRIDRIEGAIVAVHQYTNAAANEEDTRRVALSAMADELHGVREIVGSALQGSLRIIEGIIVNKARSDDHGRAVADEILPRGLALADLYLRAGASVQSGAEER